MVCPLLVAVTVWCETIQPALMADIVDQGVMQRDLTVIAQKGSWMILASLAGLLFSILNVWIASRTAIRFGTDLRRMLFADIQRLSFTDIDRFSPASLVTRLTSDISRIQQVVLMSMRMMLRSPLLLIMAVFFVVRTDVRLALVLLAAIPVLGLGIYGLLKKGFPYFLKVQQKLDRLNAVVRENLINIRVVKSFVREEAEDRKFTDSSEELRDTVIRASDIIVSVFPMMQLVMNASIAAILWVGGRRVMGGDLMVGELIAFVNYLTQVLMALMLLSMFIMTVARANASSRRIVEVLDTPSAPEVSPEARGTHHRITTGDLVFHRVSFRYENGENDVLKEISFHIRAGEKVALVGATGSAKTSLVQLIPRLYRVTQGEIRIDGVRVEDYYPEELHRAVGMVLQKNVLFTGTILENLRWGNPQATREEVEEAALAAEAHGFICSFAEGYDTRLGRGGINLSGGQKQRLCIARALLRKPRILILDDSTSAVDSETELKIRHHLAQLLKDTTVLTVTQRVHTMQAADRVIVLDDGRVEAIGTPAELMQTSAVYREIYASQQIKV